MTLGSRRNAVEQELHVTFMNVNACREKEGGRAREGQSAVTFHLFLQQAWETVGIL